MSEVRTRKHQGAYFVVVDGVPRHCQWQELKDYLRDFAKVRPGHTNVIKVNEDGTRVGYCPLPNKTEAYRAFDYLVAEGWQGLDIRVSVIWKADMHSQDVQRKRGPEPSRRKRLQRNVSPIMRLQSGTRYTPPSVGLHNYNLDAMTQSLSNIPMPVTNEPSEPRSYPAILPDQTFMGRSEAPYQFYTPSTTQAYDYRTEIPQPPNPVSMTPSHPQRNHPTLSKGRQSIHISRLRHDIQAFQLKQLIAPYGPVSEIVITRGEEKRCSATARYHRSADAALAIRELNGKLVDGLELVVRHDRSEDAPGSTITSPTTAESTTATMPSRLKLGPAPLPNSKAATATPLPNRLNRHRQDNSSANGSCETSSEDGNGHGDSGRAGPLVVNGAQGTSHYRRRRPRAYDDDSESAADSSSELARSRVRPAGTRNGNQQLRSCSWSRYREQIPTQ